MSDTTEMYRKLEEIENLLEDKQQELDDCHCRRDALIPEIKELQVVIKELRFKLGMIEERNAIAHLEEWA